MDKFKLIVLDCDGVILESVDAKTRAFGKLVEKHGQKAKQKMVDYHLAHGGVSRFSKFAWFYREVLGREITKQEKDELGRLFIQYCFDEVMNSRFVPGVMEFISSYHQKISLYVASGAPHEELTEIIKARNLMHFFKGVYGSPPTKTEILADIVKRERVLPSETLMIGDSNTDLEAATSVGTFFYGRGVEFSISKWPWAEDLTRLSEYIKNEKNEDI